MEYSPFSAPGTPGPAEAELLGQAGKKTRGQEAGRGLQPRCPGAPVQISAVFAEELRRATWPRESDEDSMGRAARRERRAGAGSGIDRAHRRHAREDIHSAGQRDRASRDRGQEQRTFCPSAAKLQRRGAPDSALKSPPRNLGSVDLRGSVSPAWLGPPARRGTVWHPPAPPNLNKILRPGPNEGAESGGGRGPVRCARESQNWGRLRVWGSVPGADKGSLAWARLEGDVDRHYLVFKPRSNKTEKGTAVDEFHFRGGQIRSQNQPPKVEGA